MEQQYIYRVYIDQAKPENCKVMQLKVLRTFENEQLFYELEKPVLLNDKTYRTNLVSDYYIDRWVNITPGGSYRCIMKTAKEAAERLFKDEVYKIARQYRDLASNNLNRADAYFALGEQYERYDD